MSVDVAGPAMAFLLPTHTVLWEELFAAPDVGAGARPTMAPQMFETLSLLARRPRRDERPFEWVGDPFRQLLLEHASQLTVEAACLQERRRSAEGVALCGEPQECALAAMSQLRSEEAALFAECTGQEGFLSP